MQFAVLLLAGAVVAGCAQASPSVIPKSTPRDTTLASTPVDASDPVATPTYGAAASPSSICSQPSIPATVGPTSLNQQLLGNFGGESGSASGDGYDVIRPVPSWRACGGFTVVQYGAKHPPDDPKGHIFPQLAQAPPNSGSNFFSCGPDPGGGASQDIKLIGRDGEIDAGQVSALVVGHVGSYIGQTDWGAIRLQVKSTTTGSVLKTATTTKHALDGVFHAKAAEVSPLPVGTRSIAVSLIGFHQYGYCDAYFDNLDVRLELTPSQLPMVGFTHHPVGVERQLSLDASESSVSGASIVSYAWDFGDGSTETMSAPTVTHAFPMAGERYVVRLTVTDSTGKVHAPKLRTVFSLASSNF